MNVHVFVIQTSNDNSDQEAVRVICDSNRSHNLDKRESAFKLLEINITVISPSLCYLFAFYV